MSHSQFHRINWFILRHAWLNLWDKHMTTGRINQVSYRRCNGVRIRLTRACAAQHFARHCLRILFPPCQLSPHRATAKPEGWLRTVQVASDQAGAEARSRRTGRFLSGGLPGGSC